MLKLYPEIASSNPAWPEHFFIIVNAAVGFRFRQLHLSFLPSTLLSISGQEWTRASTKTKDNYYLVQSATFTS